MTNTALLRELMAAGRIRIRDASFLDTVPQALESLPADKVRGMMLGLAIGDALGNTSESRLPHERYRDHGEIRDYLPNRYENDEPLGFPSDDTQLSFWTLEQLIEDGGLVPERLGRRFAGRRIYGLGGTVKGFLRTFAAGDKPWYECGPHSAGNGALMRIAPVLIPHLERPSEALWADTVLCATLTHNDYASNAACVAFVSMLWSLLGMRECPPETWWLERYVSVARELEGETHYQPRGGERIGYRGPIWAFTESVIHEALEKNLPVLDAGHIWYSGAFLMETIPSALFIAMKHGRTFEEAVVRAVNDTKDNDTIAAIVGALVGALHGAEKIPPRWVRGLLGRTERHDDGRVFELLDAACERWVR